LAFSKRTKTNGSARQPYAEHARRVEPLFRNARPAASGSELTLENGYAALYRGSAGGLIPQAAWLKCGETGGLHTGTDVGPVGDLNGRSDITIATPRQFFRGCCNRISKRADVAGCNPSVSG